MGGWRGMPLSAGRHLLGCPRRREAEGRLVRGGPHRRSERKEAREAGETQDDGPQQVAHNRQYGRLDCAEAGAFVGRGAPAARPTNSDAYAVQRRWCVI